MITDHVLVGKKCKYDIGVSWKDGVWKVDYEYGIIVGIETDEKRAYVVRSTGEVRVFDIIDLVFNISDFPDVPANITETLETLPMNIVKKLGPRLEGFL